MNDIKQHILHQLQAFIYCMLKVLYRIKDYKKILDMIAIDGNHLDHYHRKYHASILIKNKLLKKY